MSRTRPGSETEQPSVTQKPSTPTNATRGRSNQQEKSTTWAFSFDRATPSFLSKRISGNQGRCAFKAFRVDLLWSISLCITRSEGLDRRKERRPTTRSIFFDSRFETTLIEWTITVHISCSRIWLARPSWTRMSSQRGFPCAKPLAKQASVLAWV